LTVKGLSKNRNNKSKKNILNIILEKREKNQRVNSKKQEK